MLTATNFKTKTQHQPPGPLFPGLSLHRCHRLSSCVCHLRLQAQSQIVLHFRLNKCFFNLNYLKAKNSLSNKKEFLLIMHMSLLFSIKYTITEY